MTYPMTNLRALRCDDCPFASRFVGLTAFERAKRHAERMRHRTRVLAASENEEDTVYDYRPASSTQAEDPEERS